MSSIAESLLDCLRSVERSGSFCVGGLRDILMPAIDVEVPTSRGASGTLRATSISQPKDAVAVSPCSTLPLRGGGRQPPSADGSPHILVATKNQASYARRAKQHMVQILPAPCVSAEIAAATSGRACCSSRRPSLRGGKTWKTSDADNRSKPRQNVVQPRRRRPGTP
jgi:hypothetical protein